MQTPPISHATPSSSVPSGDAVPKVGLDMSAQGLSRRTWVPAENQSAIREILERDFQGVDFTNLTAPLTHEQYDAALQLNRLGALDNNTLHDILDQHATLGHQAPAAAGHEEDAGSEASSASSDAPQSHDGSVDEALDRAERGDSPRAAGVPARVTDDDSQARRGNGFFGSLGAAGRAIGNALPRATPAVMDTVCLGLSLPVAALAIKQAIEESHKTAHDSTLLFMKATLPTVVAMNSLRNIIKYGTDGQRI